jgi:hypothetical protein
MIESVSEEKKHSSLFSGEFSMTFPRNRLIDEICQTASQHEIASLIEALGFVRESRIRLMQEAFSKEASVAAAKLQLPAEPGLSSPRRSEARVYELHGHW